MPILIIIFVFISSNAHAYIDPAGIGSFLSLLVSGLVGFFYVFRMKLKNFIDTIKSINEDIKTYIKYVSQKKKIVFFIETKSYLPYLRSVINQISSKIEIDVISDFKLEELENKKSIRMFKFNFDFMRLLAFNSLRCNILVTTTPDLGRSKIRKNKNCKCYYYIFHSLVSTQVVYKEGSFEQFDIIACATFYQKEELEVLENYKKSKHKKVYLEAGYPFFEYVESSDKNFEKNSILIAPTWSLEINDYYSRYYSEIVKKFLNNNFKVIFRPHPQYRKKNIDDLIKFQESFISNKNFYFDETSNFQELIKSEFILTDWSGIAFEFSYINKRPVIFFETPRKIHNKNLIDKNVLENSVEFSKRNQIGMILDENLDINYFIKKLRSENEKYKSSIEVFFNQNLFEEKNSSSFISKDLIKRNSFYEKSSTI